MIYVIYLYSNINMQFDVEANHVRIIKYLNYQKYRVNNDLLQIIKEISETKDINISELDISIRQYNQIKNMVDIFHNVPILNGNSKSKSNLDIYYIFIMLNLPSNTVKNISRDFLARLFREQQTKTIYNYLELLHRNNYLDDLISILQDVKNKNPENINLLIESLHNFFT